MNISQKNVELHLPSGEVKRMPLGEYIEQYGEDNLPPGVQQVARGSKPKRMSADKKKAKRKATALSRRRNRP